MVRTWVEGWDVKMALESVLAMAEGLARELDEAWEREKADASARELVMWWGVDWGKQMELQSVTVKELARAEKLVRLLAVLKE